MTSRRWAALVAVSFFVFWLVVLLAGADSPPPPAFVVMCSHPDKLPDSYSRYLVNGLRDDFDMPGTPIRLFMRSQADKNPYKDKKNWGAPSRLRKHLGKGKPKG